MSAKGAVCVRRHMKRAGVTSIRAFSFNPQMIHVCAKRGNSSLLPLVVTERCFVAYDSMHFV